MEEVSPTASGGPKAGPLAAFLEVWFPELPLPFVA